MNLACPKLAALACLALAACGGGGGNPATTSFSASSVAAQRNPPYSPCGVDDPPFSSEDQFSLTIAGKPPTGLYNEPEGGLPNELVLRYDGSFRAVLGEPIALAVQAYPGPGPVSFIGPDGGTRTYEYQEAFDAGADASDPEIDFAYYQGDDPAEIDTGAFDSVTVTFLAVPSADGDPLTARVHVHFVDGKVIDATYSAPLKPSPRDARSIDPEEPARTPCDRLHRLTRDRGLPSMRCPSGTSGDPPSP